MAHLLSKTPLDDKQARYCQTVMSSGAVLSALITDLLDLPNSKRSNSPWKPPSSSWRP
jgi:hypothetical protein